jgi:membrane-associated phospholipid phosphatase
MALQTTTGQPSGADLSTQNSGGVLKRTALVLCIVTGLMLVAWGTKVAATGHIMGWEVRVLTLIGSWQAHNGVVLWAAKLISASVWLGAIIAAGLYIRRQYHALWRYACIVSGACGLAIALQFMNVRERPALINEAIVAKVAETSGSFPSTHAAFITAAGLAVMPLLPWYLRWLPIVWLGAVVWARLYMGVQAPLDVLVGALFGLVVACCVYVLPVRLQCWLRFCRQQRVE